MTLMIKESIQEEDITIINIYASKIRALKYIQLILTDRNRQIDGNTIRLEEILTPHSHQCTGPWDWVSVSQTRSSMTQKKHYA